MQKADYAVFLKELSPQLKETYLETLIHVATRNGWLALGNVDRSKNLFRFGYVDDGENPRGFYYWMSDTSRTNPERVSLGDAVRLLIEVIKQRVTHLGRYEVTVEKSGVLRVGCKTVRQSDLEHLYTIMRTYEMTRASFRGAHDIDMTIEDLVRVINL